MIHQSTNGWDVPFPAFRFRMQIHQAGWTGGTRRTESSVANKICDCHENSIIKFIGSDHPEAFGSVWNFEKSLKALGLNLAKFKKQSFVTNHPRPETSSESGWNMMKHDELQMKFTLNTQSHHGVFYPFPPVWIFKNTPRKQQRNHDQPDPSDPQTKSCRCRWAEDVAEWRNTMVL